MNEKQMSAFERAELHLHTVYSEMKGLCSVADAVYFAANAGHKALAITDYMAVQAFPEAAAACRQARAFNLDFKVIYGCEIDFVPGSKRRGVFGLKRVPGSFRVMLLAANQKGLKNLYKIITESSKTSSAEGTGSPKVSQSLLEEHREGLLVGAAFAKGELFQALHLGRNKNKITAAARFYDYLEIQPAAFAEPLKGSPNIQKDKTRKIISSILEIGKKLEKPVAATGNVHFLHPEDAMAYAVLQTPKEGECLVKPQPLFFRSTDEMLLEFSWLPPQDAYNVVVGYPNRLAAMVSPDIRPMPLSTLFMPEIKGSEADLRAIVWEKAKYKYGDPVPGFVKKRIDRELDGIFRGRHASLFMLAQILAEKSLQAGYPRFSRGKAGSSLAAYFAGITEVNPLPPHYLCRHCRYSKPAADDGSVESGFDLPAQSCPVCGMELFGDGHNIPSEIFLGLNGDELPIIDINYSIEFAGQAYEHLSGCFGENRVFYGGSIKHMGENAAGKHVKTVLESYGKAAFNEGKCEAVANKLAAVKTSDDWFSGSLFIVPDKYDMHDFTPVQYMAVPGGKTFPCTHLDYRQIQKTLLRINVLAHDTATLLHRMEKLTAVSIGDIPMTDSKVYSLLASPNALGVSSEAIGWETGTLGVPELDTPLICSIMRTAKVHSFGGLIKALGLSQGVGTWYGNAREIIQSGQGTYSDVIGSRDDLYFYLLGKGVEKEQAFAIMEQVMSGQALRKGLDSGTEALLREHGAADWFVPFCEKTGYLFPKSHAVAQLIASLRILWYKLYHPRAFYSALFTVQENRFGFYNLIPANSNIEACMKKLYEKDERSFEEEEKLKALQIIYEGLCRGIKLVFS